MAEAAAALARSQWTVQVIGQKRARQLRLGQIVPRSAGQWAAEAWYGWSDGNPRAVPATLVLHEGELLLRLTTPADSALAVSPTGPGTMEGVMLAKDGRELEVRLLRQEVATARAGSGAAHPGASRLAARPASSVRLVYLGGDDCPPCRWWKAHDLPLLQQNPLFQQIRFHLVDKPVRGTVPPAVFLPAELKPLKAQMDVGSGGYFGSAQVAVFVDDQLFDYYFGTRTAEQVLQMLQAITEGGRYPFERCLARANRLECARVAGR